jgi:hypothetical protein
MVVPHIGHQEIIDLAHTGFNYTVEALFPLYKM